MGEMVYQSLETYFYALEKKGHVGYKDVQKLLLLCFYWDFIYNDYRGLLTKEDYLLIERALNCLYGTTCLIPYPDYLKMGKLHLGEMSEMAQRVKTLEDTPVMKVMNAVEGDDTESDICVIAED